MSLLSRGLVLHKVGKMQLTRAYVRIFNTEHRRSREGTKVSLSKLRCRAVGAGLLYTCSPNHGLCKGLGGRKEWPSMCTPCICMVNGGQRGGVTPKKIGRASAKVALTRSDGLINEMPSEAVAPQLSCRPSVCPAEAEAGSTPPSRTGTPGQRYMHSNLAQQETPLLKHAKSFCQASVRQHAAVFRTHKVQGRRAIDRQHLSSLSSARRSPKLICSQQPRIQVELHVRRSERS
jgi:hypothetical protein